MGRNIWQSDHPVAMIKAVKAIVHQNLKVKEAQELFNKLKLEPKSDKSAKPAKLTKPTKTKSKSTKAASPA